MMDQDFFDWYWERPAVYHKMVNGNDVGETRKRRILAKQACYKMASQQSGVHGVNNPLLNGGS